MPITLAGSARRRVVERDTGAGAVAGSAHGSTDGGGRRGCAASADGVLGAAGRGDVAYGVDSAARGAADGTARGATDGTVRGAADGTARGGALGCAASLPGAGAAGGEAFTRAPRAAGLFGSKGGGSVGFLTWSEDEVVSVAPPVFAGGELGSPLCA
jgi:hypothetical protein